MEKLPEWFPAVPVFEPTDPVFCLATYFLFCDEDDDCNGGFETKKYSADWVENNDLQFIQWHENWQILYDWDEDKVMICRHEQAYETNSINLYLLDAGTARWEIEDVVVSIAKKFIDALASVQSSPGQLELALCTQ